MVNYTPALNQETDTIEKILAEDVMTQDFRYLSPEDNITHAMQLLLDHHLSGAIVLKDKKVVGFFSTHDCLKLVLQMKYHNGPAPLVKDYMSKEVIYLRRKAPLLDAVEVFVERRFRIIPIVDQDSTLVIGMLERENALRALGHTLQTTW